MKNVIIGLDLGASTLYAVAANADEAGRLDVLGAEMAASTAIKDGAIVDADKAIKDIRNLLKNLENKIGRKIIYIYSTINDKTIKGEVSRGMVPLASRGRAITDQDIDRCIEVANIFGLPLDRELLHSLPQRFFIDDKILVTNPKGLHAAKLSVDIYAITANISSIKNIYDCVDKAGYVLKGVIFSGLAASFSVLLNEEKKNGAVLVDIGRNTTRMILFSNGILEALFILDTGCDDKYFFERIKSEYIKFFQRHKRDVVFIGEGALSEGLIERVEKAINSPARIGVAKNVKGLLGDAELVAQASSIGVIKYVVAKTESKKDRAHGLKLVLRKIWGIFDSYF